MSAVLDVHHNSLKHLVDNLLSYQHELQHVVVGLESRLDKLEAQGQKEEFRKEFDSFRASLLSELQSTRDQCFNQMHEQEKDKTQSRKIEEIDAFGQAIPQEDTRVPGHGSSGETATVRAHAEFNTATVRTLVEWEREVSFNGSSWEIAALVGFPGVGLIGSAVVVIALVLNVTMQIIFCVAASKSFSEDEFGPERQKEYQQWRVGAHREAALDRIQGATLVERVCNRDGSLSVATLQLQIYDVIHQYLSPSLFGYPAGLLMCLLALLIWWLRVMQEINAMIDYVQMLMHFRSGPLEIQVTESGAFELLYLNRSSKFLCFAITMVRFAICIVLAIVGTNFIITTALVEDLLLNALALELVLNTDEYLFVTLVPKRVQDFVEKLTPTSLGAFKHVYGLTIRSAFVVIFTPCFLILIYYTQLQPHVDNIKAVERVLCWGKKDFVFITSSQGLPHATTDFNYRVSGMTGSDINDLNIEAVTSATLGNVDASSPENMLIWERGVDVLAQLEKLDREANADHLQTTCEDLLTDPECAQPAVLADGRCPTGYMLPRDAAECRDVAITLGLWNKSSQRQQARVDYEADLEPYAYRYLQVPLKPCVLDSATGRFFWTGRAGLAMTGPCLCRPKNAKVLTSYAVLFNKFPISSCDDLEKQGACVYINPPLSALTEVASFARTLCPQACGCNLWPPSPYRNVYAAPICHHELVVEGLDRPCEDVALGDWQDMPQLRFLREDLFSMYDTHDYLRFLVLDFETRGCDVLTVLQSPYEEHSSQVAGPPCELDLQNGERTLSCLMVRCQDYDEDKCQDIKASNACYLPSFDPRAENALVCPRSCGFCLNAPTCTWDETERARRASIHPHSILQGHLSDQYNWTAFFRGSCPVTCGCATQGRFRNGCPPACMSN